MSFITTLPHVLKHEGGYANNPLDSGGETFRGLARSHNRDWPGWLLIDAVKRAGVTTATAIDNYFAHNQQMADLVTERYLMNYYTPVARFTTHERPVDKMFEAAVNIGPLNAIQIAQAIVGAVADGAIGPKTLAAATAFFARPGAEDIFISEFCYRQLERYARIVADNQSQVVFLRSWMTRAAWRPRAAWPL